MMHLIGFNLKKGKSRFKSFEDKPQKYSLHPLFSYQAKAELKAEEVAEVFISSERFGKPEFFEFGIEKMKMNKEMMKNAEFKQTLTKWPQLLFKIMENMLTSE